MSSPRRSPRRPREAVAPEITSSPLAQGQRGQPSELSSPLRFPTSSSPPQTPQTPQTPRSDALSARSAPSSAPSTPYTPTRGGPVRTWLQRSDLGSVRLFDNTSQGDINDTTSVGRDGVSSEPDGTLKSFSDSLNDPVIWGTTVVVNDVFNTFKGFLENYRDPLTDQLFFPPIIQRIYTAESHHMNLDTAYLRNYKPTKTLYNLLLAYPQEVIPIMDLVVNATFDEMYPKVSTERGIQVRPYNLETKTNMRELNPTDIDRLICLKGMVIRASSIVPDLKLAFFQCLKCGSTVEKEVDRGRVEEPTRCENPDCNANRTMTIVFNRCKYTDKQLIRIQETPDTVPDGQTPHTVSIVAYEELVDVPRPGDRVEVTGVYRAVPVRVNPNRRSVHQLYRTYVDVVHFKQVDAKRVRANRKDVDPEEYAISLEEAEVNLASAQMLQDRVKALSKEPDIYQRLVRSIAPSIYEMESVKKGVLCQLFGGTNKGSKTSLGRFRGEINVLLCGDPGTSKSQTLQYVHKIAPRGIYTSGKGSSAVGLTAYVTKDPDSKQYVLESGALVLSDGGICCIDEFDKMSDSTRSVLHEVMEQQTVSIAKAGIICTLNARTSILASANPQNSRYDPDLSVVENLQLPPTLVSRFDLIYLILDKPEESHDRRLAKHIVSMYQNQQLREQQEGILDQETLTAYISYAREQIHPELSEDASRDLVEAYSELRRGSNSRNTVSATPRQLESLIRLSEALAKTRLSNVVERKDVQEAMKLMKIALLTAATDPTTGRVDMDLITTGQSASARSRIAEVVKIVREILLDRSASTTIRFNKLMQEVNTKLPKPVSSEMLQESIRELESIGALTMVGDVRTGTALVRKVADALEDEADHQTA